MGFRQSKVHMIGATEYNLRLNTLARMPLELLPQASPRQRGGAANAHPRNRLGRAHLRSLLFVRSSGLLCRGLL